MDPVTDSVPLRVFEIPGGFVLQANMEHDRPFAYITPMLREQGLNVTFRAEQSGGAAYEELTVLLGSGGALTALVHVLHKYLELRREKSIHIETGDGMKVITKGISVGEFERVLRSTRDSSRTESSQSRSQDPEPPHS